MGAVFVSQGLHRGFCRAFSALCRLFLLQGRKFAAHLLGDFLQGLEGARRHANLHTAEANLLEVHFLAMLGSDVGVAASLAKVGRAACQLIDARHRFDWRNRIRIRYAWQDYDRPPVSEPRFVYRLDARIPDFAGISRIFSCISRNLARGHDG